MREIAERFGVHREDAARRPVLGRHVRDGGAVRERQVGEAGAEELHELPDHALLAQHLRDGQHEVGRGSALLAREFEADHLRNEHRHGLTEHRGFSFDTPDAPAQDTEAVNHCGVAVGADERVRVGVAVLVVEHHASKVFEVHLMADAGARRDHLEVVERFLAPTKERVPLVVPLVLQHHVVGERLGSAVLVHLHGVIDDEFDGHERVDLGGVAAERLHGVAHGGEIDHARHPGEVLHQHTRRGERDLHIRLGFRIPLRQGLDVRLPHREAHALVAEQIFEQDLERVGELPGLRVFGLDGREFVDRVRLTADRESVVRLPKELPVGMMIPARRESR